MSAVYAWQRAGHIKYVPSGRRDMNNGPAAVPSAASNSVGAAASQGLEMLSSMLAAASPQQQKQILGERLFPLVKKHKVLSMLAEAQRPCILLSLFFFPFLSLFLLLLSPPSLSLSLSPLHFCCSQRFFLF